MQKIAIIFIVVALAVAVAVPIFADDISNAQNGTNIANATNDSEYGNNSSIIDNDTLTNSTNSMLPQQLQLLITIQGKLVALMTTMENLKANYTDIKPNGLLNALNQFEKQDNKLNSQITAFIQNSTAGNSTVESSINGRINSFEKREPALEHKVAVKQEILSKQNTKTGNGNSSGNQNNNGHNK